MKCTEVQFLNPTDLTLLPNNPRKITKADFQRLVDSIKINGFWKHRPLALEEQEGKLVVLAGNQRTKELVDRTHMAQPPGAEHGCGGTKGES